MLILGTEGTLINSNNIIYFRTTAGDGRGSTIVIASFGADKNAYTTVGIYNQKLKAEMVLQQIFEAEERGDYTFKVPMSSEIPDFPDNFRSKGHSGTNHLRTTGKTK